MKMQMEICKNAKCVLDFGRDELLSQSRCDLVRPPADTAQIREPRKNHHRCERKNDEDANDDEHEWMCDWQSLGWLCRCDIICAIGKFQITKDWGDRESDEEEDDTSMDIDDG